MLIKKPDDVPSSEITPKSTYLDRRTFMRGLVTAGSVAATGLLYKEFLAPPRARRQSVPLPADQVTQSPGSQPSSPSEKLNSYEEITNYNNYYEFSTDKYAVAEKASHFVARPWTVAVGGLCAKPKTWDIDEIFRRFPLEERIYRLRCVEGWSMVVPWNGFSLGKLLAEHEPLAAAKFVQLTTLQDPERMPNQRGHVLPWPYLEGLRLDEAMHPLATLAGGLYGETLPPQNGAPLRLIVPWKYGFKSGKAIVKIDFVDKQPRTTWNRFAPDEYGFYSNVNPDVDHPRWSQARERRLGELGKRDTLMFNGYGAEVASLYAGMDLKVDF